MNCSVIYLEQQCIHYHETHTEIIPLLNKLIANNLKTRHVLLCIVTHEFNLLSVEKNWNITKTI